jgi:hypothetical protein
MIPKHHYDCMRSGTERQRLESKTKYIVSWEDESTHIVYNEPYEDTVPLLQVAFRFKKTRESERGDLKVNVKSITILPSQSNPETKAT